MALDARAAVTAVTPAGRLCRRTRDWAMDFFTALPLLILTSLLPVLIDDRR